MNLTKTIIIFPTIIIFYQYWMSIRLVYFCWYFWILEDNFEKRDAYKIIDGVKVEFDSLCGLIIMKLRLLFINGKIHYFSIF